MGGAFVNYRTGDGEWAALLIFKALTCRFGADQVFYASSSILPGDNYPEEIHRWLAKTDVLLTVIGSRWLVKDDFGNRRLDEKNDWVRHEIRTAFAHGVRVIPVLLDDVARLSEHDLPSDIAALANCQHLRLRHRDRDDVAALVDKLTPFLQPATNEPWRARIHDARGAVQGAGVLLAGQYVLVAIQSGSVVAMSWLAVEA
jgi:hypothetical protein